jgi:ABC-type uncharacterized transport system fused permease/ATPase subunit
VLQEPDFLIVDKSLAALDPAGRLVMLEVLGRREIALIVIGHKRLRPARGSRLKFDRSD